MSEERNDGLLPEGQDAVMVYINPQLIQSLADVSARKEQSFRELLEAAEDETEFELMTAIGMVYFLKAECDIVVLETGLGGRLDSTNVIPAPEAAVITHIGLEHTELLGDTVEKIAAEKAGITLL